MQGRAARALFLDRDGVINEETHYLFRREDVRFLPGLFSLCRTARRLGYRIVIATNQSGIARGFYTEQDFQALMAWMTAEMANHGAAVDAVYHCPFSPDGLGQYKRDHEDRKPGTGMLRRAARDLAFALEHSVMVGDRCTDIGAANAAGLRQAFLLAGTGSSPCAGDYRLVESLAGVERWLLERWLVEEP